MERGCHGTEEDVISDQLRLSMTILYVPAPSVAPMVILLLLLCALVVLTIVKLMVATEQERAQKVPKRVRTTVTETTHASKGKNEGTSKLAHKHQAMFGIEIPTLQIVSSDRMRSRESMSAFEGCQTHKSSLPNA